MTISIDADILERITHLAIIYWQRQEKEAGLLPQEAAAFLTAMRINNDAVNEMYESRTEIGRASCRERV